MKYSIHIKKTIICYEIEEAYDIIAKNETEAIEIALSGNAEHHCIKGVLEKGEVIKKEIIDVRAY